MLIPLQPVGMDDGDSLIAFDSSGGLVEASQYTSLFLHTPLASYFALASSWPAALRETVKRAFEAGEEDLWCAAWERR
jgi:hypothetical protein